MEGLSASRQIKVKSKQKSGSTTKRNAAAAALTDDAAANKKVKGADARRLEQLKAKLDKARAAAGVAIAEDAHSLIPEQMRVHLEVKTNELDILETDIDLVVKGDHAQLNPEKVYKSTHVILRKHAGAVKRFTAVLKDITKFLQDANPPATE